MITGNEQAVPLEIDKAYCYNGLTKREYFAAMAMQGLLSNPALFNALPQLGRNHDSDKFYAEVAIEHANALIAELNKS